MSSSQLANEDLINYRKEREKISLQNVLKTDEDELKKSIIKNEVELHNTSFTSNKNENGMGSSLLDNILNVQEPVKKKPVIKKFKSPKIEIKDIKPENINNEEIIKEVKNEDNNNYIVPEIKVQSRKCKEMGWCGNIKNSWKECEVDIVVNVYHINGPQVENMLPSLLSIENRLDLKELHKYLPKITGSTSRNRTACYFQPKSEEHLDGYRKLFSYLQKINRGGVLANKQQGLFQELYIFPLAKGENIPSFISSNDIDIKEDLLIGVFLTDKRGIKRKSEDDSYLKTRTKKFKKTEKSPNSYISTFDEDDSDMDIPKIKNHEIGDNNVYQNEPNQVNSLMDTLQILTSGFINNTTSNPINSYFPNINTNFTPQVPPLNTGQVNLFGMNNLNPWNNNLNNIFPQTVTNLGVSNQFY